MTLSPQGQRWQDHLDKLFPHGTMMEWKGEVTERWQPAARVVVQEMDGLDPVIRIPCFVIDKLVGPYRLLSLDESKDIRNAYEARFAGQPKVLVLLTKVPPQVATAMAPERSQLIGLDKEDDGAGSGSPQ